MLWNFIPGSRIYSDAFRVGPEAPVPRKIRGTERFDVNLSLPDFHRYGYSNLLNTTTRGHLAEYIVAQAAGVDTNRARMEWHPYHLLTTGGVKIEVKSSAYVQAWQQPKSLTETSIRFSIAQSRAGEAQTGVYAAEFKRQADLYVFALYEPKDKKDNANFLDTQHWRFWVLLAAELDEKCGTQRSLGLERLKGMAGPGVRFEDLGALLQAKALVAVPGSLSSAYVTADFWVSEYPHNFMFHVGEPSKPLQTLLWDYSLPSAHFITACNPHSEKLSRAENEAALGHLRKRLQTLGAAAVLTGAGEDPLGTRPPEAGFLVLGLSLETGQQLARDFGQEAIVVVDQGQAPRLEWVK